eukprot:scaffold11342_cov68-Phaeocystis_antarctica.AAC.2
MPQISKLSNISGSNLGGCSSTFCTARIGGRGMRSLTYSRLRTGQVLIGARARERSPFRVNPSCCSRLVVTSSVTKSVTSQRASTQQADWLLSAVHARADGGHH